MLVSVLRVCDPGPRPASHKEAAPLGGRVWGKVSKLPPEDVRTSETAFLAATHTASLQHLPPPRLGNVWRVLHMKTL